MPRRSVEDKAAELWRSGVKTPPAPADLAGPAADLWRRIASGKPPYYWTESAQLLLSRLCRSAATVAVLHTALDADPLGEGSSDLNRRVVALNASVAMFARQLRLNPVQEISSDSRERIGESRSPFNDDELLHPLIGVRQ